MATALAAPRARLMTHCGARRISRADLVQLPAPQALGSRHRPLPHHALVDAIRSEAAARGLSVAREEYAVNRGGAALFGVMDLVGEGVQTRALSVPGGGIALGLRSSTDESIAIGICSGARTFVCDNMAFAGDVFALKRKSTTGLNLDRTIVDAFDRFLDHSTRFVAALERLQNSALSDADAREVIYDATARQVIPLRLFPEVHRNYFEIDREARPECVERTSLGLHSAFTRAFKLLAPARAWTANVALGRLFGLESAA